MNNEAVDLFLQASEHEREGKISEAIKLYARAFRIDPDVDQKAKELYSPYFTATESVEPIQFKVFSSFYPKAVRTVEQFDYSIMGMNDQILLKILEYVGIFNIISLEECAKTCKKLYLLSRSEQVWAKVYKFTRASKTTTVPTIHPRILFFKDKHLRTDGVYICKISYLRPGTSDGLANYQPIHLVTYYRYLRFFSCEYGYRCIGLVSAMDPKDAIKCMRNIPTIPSTDSIMQGDYHRTNDSDFQINLKDPNASHKYTFKMSIRCKSTRVFSCTRYTALNLNDGREIDLLNGENWTKFVFSRVKSFIS